MSNLQLKFIAIFDPLWQRLGANPAQLRAILDAKLKMDSRRQSAFRRGYSHTAKETKGQDWLSIIVHFFFGLMLGVLIAVVPDKTTALTLYFSAWMVFLAMTIITDFTEVLMDVRDNYILLPKPVSDRTLTLSRILHIFLYLSKNALAFTLPALIILVFVRPSGLPVFLLQSLIVVLMVVFIVNAFYLLMLRLTTPRRFRDIINYFQIGFSILIFAAYYLLPKLFDFSSIETAQVLNYPASYIAPPLWIAAIWKVLVELDFGVVPLVLSGLAVIVTAIGGYLVATVLAKNLSRKLIAITQGEKESDAVQPVKTISENGNWGTRFASILTTTPAESAAFQFTWLQTLRNRDYKLKTYPALGFIPIFFIYLAVNGEGSISDRLASLHEGEKYLVLIYLCVAMVTTPLTNTLYSEKFKASWVFFVTPVERPGEIILGSFKAILSQFLLPYYAFAWVTGLLIWGWEIMDDYLLGLSVLTLFALSILKILFNKIPFSQSWTELNKGSNTVKSILALLFVAVAGGLHYLVAGKTIWILAAAIVVAALAVVMYKSVRLTPWKKIA